MLTRRHLAERLFKIVAVATLVIVLATLAALLLDAFIDGAGRLSWQFLTSFPSRKPEEAGILAALVGTTYLMILTAVVA
ncbi:MAG: phosphate ABC transporter permease PstA, partial [Candidatus Methylomirabilales bacterium]